MHTNNVIWSDRICVCVCVSSMLFANYIRKIKFIFTKGNVRAESYTRPKQHYQNGIVNGAQESRQQEVFGPECTPDPTLGEALQDTEEPLNLDDDEEELLHRLATRHYYR